MIHGEKVSIQIVKNADFSIPTGTITLLLGKSGSGKTTLLRTLAGLNPNYKGELFVTGKELKSLSQIDRASQIGIVFQQFHLFPHMTVLENCMHPLLKVKKVDKNNAEKCAIEMLELLGMEGKKNSYPKTLSGGEMQRCAIARSLSLGAKVILLDEPTSALDRFSSEKLFMLLQALIKKGVSVVLSSHDLHFIKKILSRVYIIEDGSIIESFDAAYESIEDKPQLAKFLESEYHG